MFIPVVVLRCPSLPINRLQDRPMTPRTPAQQALVVLAKRLPLKTRRELAEHIELLETMLDLPHELTRDQRSALAGTNGKSHWQVRRETDRGWHIAIYGSHEGEYFNAFDAAFLMGWSVATLRSLCPAGRSVDRIRTSNPWSGATEILVCVRVPEPDDVPPLRTTTVKWLADKRRRAEVYAKQHQPAIA